MLSFYSDCCLVLLDLCVDVVWNNGDDYIW